MSEHMELMLAWEAVRRARLPKGGVVDPPADSLEQEIDALRMRAEAAEAKLEARETELQNQLDDYWKRIRELEAKLK